MKNSVTLLHNPGCSKSRATAELLQRHNIEFEVIDYLNQPPDKETLLSIIAALGINTKGLLRTGEAVYQQLDLRRESVSNEEALQAMLDNPVLIERPIVIYNGKAAIGRPIENIVELLGLS